MIVHPGELLRPYNTLALQSRTQACVAVDSEDALLTALDWARERELPVVPLGEGSNVVLAGDLNALVVLQKMRGIEVVESGSERVRLRVSAGENWHKLVHWTLQQGYFGLENLALIPGKVGAAPIQNIGAYGVELRSVLQRVYARLIDSGDTLELNHAECDFGYRDSVFKHALRDKLVITAVDIELSLQPQVTTTYPAIQNFLNEHGVAAPTPQQVFDAVVAIRRSKLPDPGVVPNAGSFFKNPVVGAAEAQALHDSYPQLPMYPQPDGTTKLAAAWMIEHCGWKGFREGDIGVHPEHALVLVNYGSESGAQLLAVAHQIADSVHRCFAVRLEIEPRVYGERP